MNRSRPTTVGVRRIIAFNWPKLGAALAAVVAAAAVRMVVTTAPAVDLALLLTAAGVASFVVSSLAVSWWVYDRSDLHDWHWLRPLLPADMRRWVLVHAGFDEAGPALADVVGPAEAVVDMSPGLRRTSASLRRARRRHPAGGTAVADACELPLPSSTYDGVLVVFAAHEVRDRRQRELLFDEIRRVLVPGGHLVLVEHLRDPANLAAFGAGALHFQSRHEWMRLAARSRFSVRHEVAKTSFIRGFALCPS